MTKEQIETLKQIEAHCDQLFALCEGLMGEMTHDTYEGPDGGWNGFDCNEESDRDIYFKIGDIHEAAERASAEFAEYIEQQELQTA